MGSPELTLGDIIKKYREKNRMSAREFAKKCGLSRAYIGFLERNDHPTTKRPISPSLKTVIAVATAIDIAPGEILDAIGMSEMSDLLQSSSGSSGALRTSVTTDDVVPFRFIPVTEENIIVAARERRILILPFPAPRLNAIMYMPSKELKMVISLRVVQVLGGVFYATSEVTGKKRFTIFDIDCNIFTNRADCTEALNDMLSQKQKTDHDTSDQAEGGDVDD